VGRRGALNAAAVIEAIKGRGAKVWTEGGKLRYSGPKDVLGPEVLCWLRKHKQEVMTLLVPAAPVHAAPEAPPATEDAIEISRFARRQLEKAQRLGLVTAWSRHFGYVSIHDPATGEWHDLCTGDAPNWAKREAFKRKELHKDGNHKAFSLTSREMKEIWEAEHVAEPEGIVEDHPLEEERE
jgi:hypothetical protein